METSNILSTIAIVVSIITLIIQLIFDYDCKMTERSNSIKNSVMGEDFIKDFSVVIEKYINNQTRTNYLELKEFIKNTLYKLYAFELMEKDAYIDLVQQLTNVQDDVMESSSDTKRDSNLLEIQKSANKFIKLYLETKILVKKFKLLCR